MLFCCALTAWSALHSVVSLDMIHSLPPIIWISTARKWPQEPLPVRVGNFWDLGVVFDSYFPGILLALTVKTQRGHSLLASFFPLLFVVPYITCVFLALRLS